MERTILHSDLNNFYASVECLHHPQLRNVPVAVAGDREARHGIVLAKNEAAKRCGVKTGNPLWMAKQKCKDIVFIPPHHDEYMKFSKLAREIYSEYTDQVESFGLDECWLDVSGSASLFGNGQAIADTIRRRIKSELGLTVSIGVSYNKIFAKLGSDLKCRMQLLSSGGKTSKKLCGRFPSANCCMLVLPHDPDCVDVVLKPSGLLHSPTLHF